jgi:type I restriction enzyme, S subunit
MNNIIHLKDITSLITKGTTPKVYSSDGKSSIKFIRVNNITKSGRIDTSELLFIDQDQNEVLKRSKLKENDILFSIAGAIGRSAIVKKKHLPANTNQALGIIRLNKLDEIDLDYIKHSLNSEFVQKQTEEEAQGGAQPNLNLQQLGNIEFWLPETLDEQKKIAEILTSVDKVIELTETEIEKLKNLKKGMMQDLLTKGIGHTKFKDSPIGKIPECWEVSKVESIAKVIDSLHKTPVFSESGYYMIRVTDIIEGVLKFDNSLKVSEEVYLDFSRNHKPCAGDIVMTRVGSFGRSSYVNKDADFCIGQNTVVINPKQNSKYLYYFLNSELAWKQILNETNGSSQGSLSLKSIKELSVAIPSEAEMNKIVDVLTSIDRQIELKDMKYRRLKNTKKGLMQDLLTGKVRVKV